MTINLYVNGVQAISTIGVGPIDWHVGASAGAWTVGGWAQAVNSRVPSDGWFHDWRVDDGVIRSAAYFKALFKSGSGIFY